MEQAAYIPDEKEKEESQNYIFNTLDDEIDKLKEELHSAVESEDYEKAAKLRDKIKQLESKS